MPIERPRRIFRAGPNAPRAPRRGVGRTLMAGIVGALGGAALVLIALPADLFGRVPALAGLVSADARHVAVVDGNTLRLRETVIRLEGVDAPLRGTACGGVAGTDCGAAATEALASLVRDRSVACRLSGRDSAGFPQALCEADGHQINRALVADGFARARADTVAFAAEERDARRARRGLWHDGAF